MKLKNRLLILIFIFLSILFINKYSYAVVHTDFYEDDYFLPSLAYNEDKIDEFYSKVYENFPSAFSDNAFSQSKYFETIKDFPLIIIRENNFNTSDENKNFSVKYTAFFCMYTGHSFFSIVPESGGLFHNTIGASYTNMHKIFTYYDNFENMTYDYNTKTFNIYGFNDSESVYQRKIVYANRDIIKSDNSQTYFYGVDLSHFFNYQAPIMDILAKYQENGFTSDGYIQVIPNDFNLLQGSKTTELAKINFIITDDTEEKEVFRTVLSKDSIYYTTVENAEDMPFFKISFLDFSYKLQKGHTYTYKLDYSCSGFNPDPDISPTSSQTYVYGQKYTDNPNPRKWWRR